MDFYKGSFVELIVKIRGWGQLEEDVCVLVQGIGVKRFFILGWDGVFEEFIKMFFRRKNQFQIIFRFREYKLVNYSISWVWKKLV